MTAVRAPRVDQFGAPLRAGDRVTRTQIDKGAPAWATGGRVVAVGRVRIVVEWDSYSYEDGDPGHTTHPGNVRKVTR